MPVDEDFLNQLFLSSNGAFAGQTVAGCVPQSRPHEIMMCFPLFCLMRLSLNRRYREPSQNRN